MTAPQAKVNKPPFEPFRVAGVVVLLAAALVLWLVYLQ
jgi:phospholipid/cholesterol/gamma-HCH transport system substrate-binding protein